MNNKINIIETTLRDGSYAINFKFTSQDTAIICRKLEESGFEYIEIGHGMGFNGTNTELGKSASTDEEYMIAAESSLTHAKYGMFCIPGIARLSDIDLAKKHNMKFIRIGTNVDKIAESEPFIKKAKENGLIVAANYMKSYALSAQDFAKQAKRSEEWGADLIYIVDSAGGMFPETIKNYFQAIREVSEIPVGFHGHNNLELAVNNSLEAVGMGITFVDSSLQGLGRSAGNACTEILIAALIKKGYSIDIDLLKTIQIGRKYIQPLVNKKGYPGLDIIAGFAEFHSSYMPHIQEFSARFGIPPEILIIELCKVDKLNFDPVVVEKIARDIKSRDTSLFLGEYGFDKYIGGEQERSI